MKLENAVQSFQDHLTIERGLSSNSISAYRRDLEKFSQFLTEKSLDFEKISESEIVEFEVWLKGSKLAITSINRNISALKSFYKYLAQEFSISNPVSGVASSKVPRRLPKALTIKEITALIDATKREGDPISLRDHAIIELLYGTGARVSEIVGIDINDFAQGEVDGNPITTLKLRGKGSKERIVPLGSFAKSALDEYLVRIRPNLLSKSKSSRVESTRKSLIATERMADDLGLGRCNRANRESFSARLQTFLRHALIRWGRRYSRSSRVTGACLGNNYADLHTDHDR
jgi:integrase/recombinase XerD